MKKLTFKQHLACIITMLIFFFCIFMQHLHSIFNYQLFNWYPRNGFVTIFIFIFGFFIGSLYQKPRNRFYIWTAGITLLIFVLVEGLALPNAILDKIFIPSLLTNILYWILLFSSIAILTSGFQILGFQLNETEGGK